MSDRPCAWTNPAFVLSNPAFVRTNPAFVPGNPAFISTIPAIVGTNPACVIDDRPSLRRNLTPPDETVPLPRSPLRRSDESGTVSGIPRTVPARTGTLPDTTRPTLGEKGREADITGRVAKDKGWSPPKKAVYQIKPALCRIKVAVYSNQAAVDLTKPARCLSHQAGAR